MQIFHHYEKWEDFKNGMWRRVSKEKEQEMLSIAISFTGNHNDYGAAMLRVINEWPIACEQNLTDNSINQKAFIGHCAVCLQLGIPEYITREAWGFLSQEQQILANGVAEFAINKWKQFFYRNNKSIQFKLFNMEDKKIKQYKFCLKITTTYNDFDGKERTWVGNRFVFAKDFADAKKKINGTPPKYKINKYSGENEKITSSVVYKNIISQSIEQIGEAQEVEL